MCIRDSVLLTFDLEEIAKAGYDVTTPIVITHLSEMCIRDRSITIRKKIQIKSMRQKLILMMHSDD